jgi:hypothetical protein
MIPAARDTGRLRWYFGKTSTNGGPWLRRQSELRWVGRHVQWVLSPVQIAAWTGMADLTAVTRRGFSLAPMPRAPRGARRETLPLTRGA